MSQENVDFIRGVYAAFNGRDIARAIESADPDFEWVPDARSFESAVRGREEVQRFLEDQVETLGLRVEPEEFFDLGSQVIAFVRADMSGAESGAELSVSIAHIWTFRDGTPVRGEAYADRDKALAALGLSE